MDIEFLNDKEALGWGVKMGYAACIWLHNPYRFYSISTENLNNRRTWFVGLQAKAVTIITS